MLRGFIHTVVVIPSVVRYRISSHLFVFLTVLSWVRPPLTEFTKSPMATGKVVSLRLGVRLKYVVLVSFHIYTVLRATPTPPPIPYTHTVGGATQCVCGGGGEGTLSVIDYFRSML